MALIFIKIFIWFSTTCLLAPDITWVAPYNTCINNTLFTESLVAQACNSRDIQTQCYAGSCCNHNYNSYIVTTDITYEFVISPRVVPNVIGDIVSNCTQSLNCTHQDCQMTLHGCIIREDLLHIMMQCFLQLNQTVCEFREYCKWYHNTTCGNLIPL